VPLKVTDEEFVEIWNRLREPRKIALHFDLDIRSVHSRRKSIETRLGIILPSKNTKKNTSNIKNIQRSMSEQASEKRARVYQKEINETLVDGIIMVASDAHYWPGIVSIAHQAFCKLIKELKPQIVVLNGDILDGARISRHARIMWEPQPKLKDELHAVQDRCAEIERAAGSAQLIRSIGNHDARFETMMSSSVPEIEELPGSTLFDYLPNWRASWVIHINPITDGWLSIRHRPVSGGIHASYNSTLRAGVSYVHGHLHKLQVTPWSDYRGRRYGVDTGTLAEPCGPQFNYTEAGPVNWTSGFAVLTFVSGKLLQPELCVVEHGKAWFRGKEV